MADNRLWTKLFIPNSEVDEINLHSSGATVRHRNPFEDLAVPRNEDELTKEFVDKWVAPFYMTFPISDDEVAVKSFALASKEISVETTAKLLGYFDWRPRITGAYFAAINNYKELEDIIGRHLLKSEVCYAGVGYCIALASFGTEISCEYLKKYLAYYLQRKDLWFNQADAFCALEFLDQNSSEQFFEGWKNFISDKPNWDLDRSRKHFASCLKTIQKIRETAIYC